MDIDDTSMEDGLRRHHRNQPKESYLSKIVKTSNLETVDYTLKTSRQEKIFTVSKVTSVNLSSDLHTEMIHFDKLKDGTWLMCYTKGSLKEFDDNLNRKKKKKKK